ncbi:MAG: CehA/McbA family metallohydrolase [Alphaproteobacteria bacterium]|nr:CehA/McbA family metallohydrolase [Alphaproteobacteria bacterium]
MLLPLLSLLLACDAPSDRAPSECAPDGQSFEEVKVVSPSEGVAVRVPVIPVVARLGDRKGDATMRVCLDGALLPEALPLVRRRRKTFGGGVDLLATLPLESVAPGLHTLEVLVQFGDKPALHGQSRFTWDRPPHKLELVVRDGEGKPSAARVVLTNEAGFVNLGPPDVKAADPVGRDRGLHSVFVSDGDASIWLDPGRYRLIAVRGLREELGVAELDLRGDARVELNVPRVVDAEGLVTADLHVHSGRSYDSFVPDHLRLASLLTAGLDLVVMTDHGQVYDPDEDLLTLMGEARGGLLGVPGVERDLERPGGNEGSHFDLAHVNAFPVKGPDAAPFPPEDTPSVAATLDAWRARQAQAPMEGTGEALILQLNHPRGIHFRPDQDPVEIAWPLFNELGFVREQPVGEGPNAWMTQPEPGTGTTALDFEAMEIMNRFSYTLYRRVRADWFALLNQGHVITGTGNADSHALMVELAGFPVNFIEAPPSAPGALPELGALLESIREGHVVVSSGPLPGLSLSDGAQQAGPGRTLSPQGPLWAEARVQAPSWVPVPEVRLVVNGEVVERVSRTKQAGEAVDLGFRWPLVLEQDSWVLLEAGWPLDESGQPSPGGDYNLVAPGYVPLSFTNPVFVDVDGDGVWTPPGHRPPTGR